MPFPFIEVSPHEELNRYITAKHQGVRPSISREYAIELAVRELDMAGLVPTPSRIYDALHEAPSYNGGGANLNGRDADVRARVLLELGYVKTKEGVGGRWRKEGRR